MRFDVAVIGGGPAGAMAAYRLASAGVRVAILDSQPFPRDKPCGGGIQQRVLQHIPFSCDSVFRSQMDRFDFWYRLAPQFSRSAKQALVYGVLRREFDSFLLDRALTAGATFLCGHRANTISQSAKKAIVHTSAGDLEASFVVGADGANSVASRQLNPRNAYFWQFALVTEVRTNSGDLGSSSALVDWGSVPSGYGWVFPKHDHVNIGVGGPTVLGRSLGRYLQSLLGKQVHLADAMSKAKGHHLPTLTNATRIECGRVFLVGDAAGLVEPLTGEGISNACHSARLAAEAIAGHLSGTATAGAYEEAVRREIGMDLIISRRLLSLAVAFPKTVLNWFERDDAVWNEFCGVLAGASSFSKLAQTAIRNFGILKGPLSAVASTQEALKLLTWSIFERERRSTPVAPAVARGA
jgi:geranylgeranyl reductase family protein